MAQASCEFYNNKTREKIMFKPYENGAESRAFHDLTLENDLDCVSLYTATCG